jgi:hypothetical protein
VPALSLHVVSVAWTYPYARDHFTIVLLLHVLTLDKVVCGMVSLHLLLSCAQFTAKERKQELGGGGYFVCLHSN